MLEGLLLGINAHINHDLALAIADSLESEWSDLSPSQRSLRLQDHNEINRVIGETTHVVEVELEQHYAHLLHFLMMGVGPLAEWETARYIAAWRGEVWDHVVMILNAANDQERDQVRERITKRALHRAHLVFESGPVRLRLLHRPFEWLRERDLF